MIFSYLDYLISLYRRAGAFVRAQLRGLLLRHCQLLRAVMRLHRIWCGELVAPGGRVAL